MPDAMAKDGDADELLLVRDDERMSGRTTIGHTALPAGAIVDMLMIGTPHDTIRESYSDVTDGQMRVLAALLDDERVADEPGPPEPRWVACAGCVGRIDRHEPHVSETFALEVLHGRHDIETRTARPGRRWHERCAPDTWTGGR